MIGSLRGLQLVDTNIHFDSHKRFHEKNSIQSLPPFTPLDLSYSSFDSFKDYFNNPMVYKSFVEIVKKKMSFNIDSTADFSYEEAEARVILERLLYLQERNPQYKYIGFGYEGSLQQQKQFLENYAKGEWLPKEWENDKEQAKLISEMLRLLHLEEYKTLQNIVRFIPLCKDAEGHILRRDMQMGEVFMQQEGLFLYLIKDGELGLIPNYKNEDMEEDEKTAWIIPVQGTNGFGRISVKEFEKLYASYTQDPSFKITDVSINSPEGIKCNFTARDGTMGDDDTISINLQFLPNKNEHALSITVTYGNGDTDIIDAAMYLDPSLCQQFAKHKKAAEASPANIWEQWENVHAPENNLEPEQNKIPDTKPGMVPVHGSSGYGWISPHQFKTIIKKCMDDKTGKISFISGPTYMTDDEGKTVALKFVVNSSVPLFPNPRSEVVNGKTRYYHPITIDCIDYKEMLANQAVSFREGEPSLFAIKLTCNGSNITFPLDPLPELLTSQQIVEFAQNKKDFKKSANEDMPPSALNERDFLEEREVVKHQSAELLSAMRLANKYFKDCEHDRNAHSYYAKRNSWQEILAAMQKFIAAPTNEEKETKYQELKNLIDKECDKYKRNCFYSTFASQSNYYTALRALDTAISSSTVTAFNKVDGVKENITAYQQIFKTMDDLTKYATLYRDRHSEPSFLPKSLINFFHPNQPKRDEQIERVVVVSKTAYRTAYSALQKEDQDYFLPTIKDDLNSKQETMFSAEEKNVVKRWW